MSKHGIISIEDLYPTSKTKQSTTYIDTLISSFPEENKKSCSENLMKKIIEKREKKLDIYIKYYSECCDAIIEKDELNEIYMFFTIPDTPEVLDCFAIHDYKKCIEYISTKLRKQYFDTYIINSKTLFVTWKFSELHKEERN